MKFSLLILLILYVPNLYSNEFAEFSLQLGDETINDINIDYDNRGFYKYQDYIDLVNSKKNFKLYINSVNGNLYHQRVDYYEDDIGFPLQIVMTYNSGSSFEGHFGNKWQLNYNVRYAENNLNKHKILVYPDDKTVLFKYNQLNNSYNPARFIEDVLKINSNNILSLEFRSDLIAEFNEKVIAHFEDSSHHYVTKINDIYGSAIHLKYNDEKKLKRISYQSGKNIIFEYINDKLSNVILPGGKEISYQYDVYGNLIRVILPNNKYYQYKYDDCGNIISIRNEIQEIKINYDLDFRANSIINNYDDLKYELAYDTNKRVNTLIFPDNTIKQYKYDNYQRSIEVIYEMFSKKIHWNQFDQLTQVIDTDNNKTTYEYNDDRELIRIIHPDNSSEHFSWYNNDRNLIYTNQLGATTEYEFDNLGKIKSILSPNDKKIVFSRYKLGKISDILFGNGPKISFYRDDISRVKLVDINLVNQLKIGHTSEGMISSIYDYYQNKTSFIYDDENRIISVDYPDNTSYTIFYINNYDQAIVKNRANESLEYYFDKIGRINYVKDAIGYEYHVEYNKHNVYNLLDTQNIFSFAYGLDNKLVSYKMNSLPSLNIEYYNQKITDIIYDNIKYKFLYNANGLVNEIIYPNGFGKNYSYDPIGNLITYRDESDKLTLFYYDRLGRLTRKTSGGISIFYDYQDSNVISINYNDLKNEYIYYDDFFGKIIFHQTSDSANKYYFYNEIGKINEITDEFSRSFKMSYNNVNRLVEIAYPNGNKIKFDYSSAGNVIKKSDIFGVSSIYDYDKNGRITVVTNEIGDTKSYSWDRFSNLLEFRNYLGNKFQMNYSDEVIEITQPSANNLIFTFSGFMGYPLVRSIKNSDNSQIRLYYDNNFNLQRMLDDYSNSVNLQYNKANNLISLKNSNNESYEFTYDFLGRLLNILNPENNNKTFRYNSISQITNLNDYQGINYEFTYNNSSRLTNIKANSFDLSFDYDLFNNLNTFKFNNLEIVKYIYINELIDKVVSDADTISFEYDIYNRIKSKKTESNQIFNYEYYHDGYLKRIYNDVASEILLMRDKSRNITNLILNGKSIAEFNYNNSNLITNIITIDSTISFKFNNNMNLIERNFAGGMSINYYYDQIGRVTSILYPDNKRDYYKYNKKNNLSELVKFDGQTYYFDYNFNNQVTKYKFSRIDSLMIAYDEVGNINSIIHPNNTKHEFLWTSANQLNNFNVFESAWTEIRSFSDNNKSFRYRLRFSTNDTISYIFDKSLRFKALASKYYTSSLSYSSSGLSLFQSLTDGLSVHKSYDKNSKLSDLSLGAYKYEIKYDSQKSLFPIELVNLFDNYNLEFNNKLRINNLFRDTSLILRIDYNQLGEIVSLDYQNNLKYIFSYNNSNLLRAFNINQDLQYNLVYNNSNMLIDLFDNYGHSISFINDNKGNLRSITKTDKSKVDYLYDTYSNLIIFKNERYDESGFKYNKQNLLFESNLPDLTKSIFIYDDFMKLNHFKSDNPLILESFSSKSLFNNNSSYSIQLLNNQKVTISQVVDKSLYINNVTISEITSQSTKDFAIGIAGDNELKFLSQENEISAELTNDLKLSLIKTSNSDYKLLINNKIRGNTDEYVLSYGFDDKLKSINLNNSELIHYNYDNRKRIVKYKNHENKSIHYEYLPDNRILKIINEDYTVLKEYDENNRLIRSGDFQIQYDNRGNVIRKIKNSDTTYFEYYHDNRVRIINISNNNLHLIYSYDNKFIGISGVDTTYYISLKKSNSRKKLNLHAKLDGSANFKSVTDYIQFGDHYLTYSYDFVNRVYNYQILDKDFNSILQINDSNSIVSTEICSPFGDMINKSVIDDYLSLNGMYYISDLNLFYDGNRFYDPDLNQFLSEGIVNEKLPFDLYSIYSKVTSPEYEYLQLSENALVPKINPFDNRFTNIKEECNPFSIAEIEINHHFNKFAVFGAKTYNNYKVPDLEEISEFPITPELILNNTFESRKFGVTPSLPDEMLDTILLNNNWRVFPKKLIETPEGDELEVLEKYLELSDIPDDSYIRIALKKILELKVEPYKIKHNNIHREGAIIPDFDEINSYISSKNKFKVILENNMSNHKTDMQYQFKNIEPYLPIKNLNNNNSNDILTPYQNISRITDILSPSFFNDKISVIGEHVLRENVSNFLTEAFEYDPYRLTPGRVHYQQKFLALPYLDESYNYLPSTYFRKKRINLNFERK